jgi:hypothetical protein
LTRSGYPVRPDTQVVLEGFPRSGTMFAVEAFLLAQPGHVEMGHHTHTPAQVIQAVRWSIPALVLVREPEETVLSFVIRYPEIGLRQALLSYLRYHRALLPLRDRFEVASFREATTDLGAVIRRLNARYGTRFVPFEHNEENVRAVFRRIDAGDRKSFGEGEMLERSRARPTTGRSALKDGMRAAYRSPRLAVLRARAEGAYDAFVPKGSPG